MFQNIANVYCDIQEWRIGEKPEEAPVVEWVAGRYQYVKTEVSTQEGKRISKFNRTATAHLFAMRVIEDAVDRANDLKSVFSKPVQSGAAGNAGNDTQEILEGLADKFYEITRRVHRVLEPSRQYVKFALNRELAASPATFDAGELVFAATSYGAINDWRLDDKLARACELLISSLPDNGRLPTKRPFHANAKGYRTLPIGCEMTRALANLLQKTGYNFDAKFVGRMLGVFEENLIELTESSPKQKLVAWNFEGAPDPDRPAIWVTAISVLALDRIVRMLNTRINETVLKHFDVDKPERPHKQLKLHDLTYSDYGMFEFHFKSIKNHPEPTAISLQKLRAHAMRASLPEPYKRHKRIFSTILYGPPETGKTTLAESLALSARVPVLRLSPSDLILQGQELIEGRARDVFEALSMLTQCVIIFDEFEPVLKKRRGKPKQGEDKDTSGELKTISNVLREISSKEDPKFRFVLGGMLPKLIKLHDAAKKQSLVYCLGTNVLSDIDDAAKRSGRFDERFPVYKPDALSRAGALFYRLSQCREVDKASGKEFYEDIRNFMEIVARTTGDAAQLVSEAFKIEDESKKTPSQALKEIRKNLSGDVNAKIETLKDEIRLSDPDNAGADKERTFLKDYEDDYVNAFKTMDNHINEETEEASIIDFLGDSLKFHERSEP